MQKITPCLWFNFNAEEAVNHYLTIFPDSKILTVSRYGDAGPGPKGAVMVMVFQLQGQELIALNGGPQFPFSEAISMSISCETQAEVDALSEKLTSGGGRLGRCGWLKDRFGLSWQVVPSVLPRLMRDADPARARRVTEAMMQMDKIDIARLLQAAEG